MNLENFHEFISDPSNLYRISYQELKSLVVQYPYSYNLRLLLLKKGRMEKHPDFERNLQLAATYALDRKLLFDQLQHPDYQLKREELTELHEEFLELKDLASLGIFIEKEGVGEEEKPKEMRVNPAPDSEIEVDKWVDEILEETGDTSDLFEPPTITIDQLLDAIQTPESAEIEQPPAQETADVKRLVDFAVSNFIEVEVKIPEIVDSGAAEENEIQAALSEPEPETEELTETPENEPVSADIPFEITNENSPTVEINDTEPELQPVPKTSFTTWLRQFESPQIYLKSPRRPSENTRQTLEKIKTNLKSDAETIAATSLEENDEIISETLAELLAAQAQKEKAISMYEKLGLKYPEKSEFFAARIQNLKKVN